MMSVTITEIVSAAIQLSEEDRLSIVSQLLESMGDDEHLPSTLDEKFIEEMQRRRSEAIDSIPWSHLRDEKIVC